MRVLAVLLSAAFAATMLTQSVAQGASETPAAKGKVTIKVPSDGNATIAHIVLDGKVKKGRKPKAPVRRPKLKVLKAPKGVVVAASYKRDKKRKNRWHASVAITNPKGGPVLRSAASSAQVPVVILGGVDTDGNFVIVIIGPAYILNDIVGDETPAEELLAEGFNARGSSGHAYLLEMAPGLTPSQFLEANGMLARDGPMTAEGFARLGLVGVVLICSPFPGNMMEAFCDFTIYYDDDVKRRTASAGGLAAGVNGIALQFPGAQVVAQLPPAGFGGVITPGTVTWGNKNVPFTSGQTYRGNVRLNVAFSARTEIKALITTTGGPPYSEPYPGNFVP